MKVGYIKLNMHTPFFAKAANSFQM